MQPCSHAAMQPCSHAGRYRRGGEYRWSVWSALAGWWKWLPVVKLKSDWCTPSRSFPPLLEAAQWRTATGGTNSVILESFEYFFSDAAAKKHPPTTLGPAGGKEDYEIFISLSGNPELWERDGNINARPISTHVLPLKPVAAASCRQLPNVKFQRCIYSFFSNVNTWSWLMSEDFARQAKSQRDFF
jgi:hypothetical protein